MLFDVVADGGTKGFCKGLLNPLKCILGPVMYAKPLLNINALNCAISAFDDPLFDNVWIGMMNESVVQFALDLTKDATCVPSMMRRIVGVHIFDDMVIPVVILL